MKKLLIIPFVLLIVAVCLFSTGCKDAEEGCIDYGASNYDEEATESCEDCCEYNVSYGFWYDEGTANQLAERGIDRLEITLTHEHGYLEGASYEAGMFWEDESEPANCNPDQMFVQTITIARYNTTWYYRIVGWADYPGVELWTGEIYFDWKGECTIVKLENPASGYQSYSLNGSVHLSNQCSDEPIPDNVKMLMHSELFNDEDAIGAIVDTITFSGGGNPAEANFTVESLWPSAYADEPSKWTVWLTQLDGSPVCNFECEGDDACTDTHGNYIVAVNSEQTYSDININCECGEAEYEYNFSGLIKYENQCNEGPLPYEIVIQLRITDGTFYKEVYDTVTFLAIDEDEMYYNYNIGADWPYETNPYQGNIWINSANFEIPICYDPCTESTYCSPDYGDNAFSITGPATVKDINVLCKCSN